MNRCSKDKIEYLERMAHRIREDLIEMFFKAVKGHIGGSLSAVEVMVALYFHIMRVDPKNPEWPERDRFVLSKGHASATWYAVLAEKGFFPRNLLFSQFIRINGLLQEHADIKIPGVEMSSGALGQGLSAALGMSLAQGLTNKSYRVYVMLGDGEMQSGQIWEAIMACSHYEVNNLTAILDYNKLQVSDFVDRVMNIEPVAKKFEAFGWNVLEIDGHSMAEVVQALQEAKDNSSSSPTLIISHTIKGKGVSFMEGNVEWHSHVVSPEDYQKAKHELAESLSSKGDS